MPRKKKKSSPASDTPSTFHKDLKGFDIRINPFGEMESTFDIDKINTFLNNQLKDKKIIPKNSAEEKE